MDNIEIYTQLHKSTLIEIYRHMLRERDLWAPQTNDGWKQSKTHPRCLKRPKINGEITAWRQFRRMPKAVVIVCVYMDGVNPDYLQNYLSENQIEEEE